MARPDWIIFYDDDTTFSSDDGSPGEAPAVGVLVLIQENANGNWVLYEKRDYYCWNWRAKNEWVATDGKGMHDYLFHHDDWRMVLYGRWVSDRKYQDVLEKATEYWKSHAKR